MALLGAALLGQASAAPLFSDIPEDNWAMRAVRELAGKGLIQGCDDGTFQGGRAPSRYELARLAAKAWERHAQALDAYVAPADLDLMRRLLDEFSPELEAMKLREARLQKQMAGLQGKVDDWERLTFYGSWRARTAVNICPGAAGSDFTWRDGESGRPLAAGAAFTMKALLGVHAALSRDWQAGLEVAAYNSAGSKDVAAYWGTDMPGFANFWSGTAPAPQAAQTLFATAVPERLWLGYEPSATKLT